MHRAYLSLGSNLGDRWRHLIAALPIVSDGDAYRVSKVYETAPVGGVAQELFWNVVVELETEANARTLLERAHRAEAAEARLREVHWGPRTLDVDVLLVGDEVCEDPDLIVPHPRLWERSFVLVPLRELAPSLVNNDALARGDGRVRELGTLESLR